MKRFSLCILLLIISSSLIAQFTLNRKKSSFGISIDGNISNSRIKLTNEYIPIFDGTLVAADSKSKPGFGLGMFYQYQFNEKIGLKTQANLTF